MNHKSLARTFALAALGLVGTNAFAASITYETRAITNSSVLPRAEGASGIDYKGGWNQQSSVITSSNLVEFSEEKGGNNTYSHLTFNFGLNSASNTWGFQVGPDAGFGGALYMDGVQIAYNSDDLWWSNSWKNLNEIFSAANLAISTGTHKFEAFWAEKCCNGASSARFTTDGTNWQTLSANSLPTATIATTTNVSEPATLALMVAGLAGLGLRRRTD